MLNFNLKVFHHFKLYIIIYSFEIVILKVKQSVVTILNEKNEVLQY